MREAADIWYTKYIRNRCTGRCRWRQYRFRMKEITPKQYFTLEIALDNHDNTDTLL